MTQRADSLSSRDLSRLCRLIYEQSGITLSAEKKIMLEGRLKRRIATLNLASYRGLLRLSIRPERSRRRRDGPPDRRRNHQQDRLLP